VHDDRGWDEPEDHFPVWPAVIGLIVFIAWVAIIIIAIQTWAGR
jgi:hypothetical protein